MLSETFYRIALQYLPSYTNAIIKKLIHEFGSATGIFLENAHNRSPVKYRNKILPKPDISPELFTQVEKEIAWMKNHDVSLCFFNDANYPQRLRNCQNAPFLFYYKGNQNFNITKSIAIVGTRSATQYGKDVVKRIVSELAGHDVTIISGLAEGIDTVAHEQALTYNLKTYAILGSGLNMIYPPSNQKLAEMIVEKEGALITEYSHNTIPDRLNFPQRNRIIAGMADAVIVAETAKRGGSMITANIASAYKRDVFAIPGNIFDDNSSGCHELIKAGKASMLTSGKEFIEFMGWGHEPLKTVQRTLFVELTEKEKQIIQLFHDFPLLSIDDITMRCNMFTPSQVAGILLGLELKGVIECLPGKCYKML
jgi:DNA processing protein